jgi:hypothetical protein
VVVHEVARIALAPFIAKRLPLIRTRCRALDSAAASATTP